MLVKIAILLLFVPMLLESSGNERDRRQFNLSERLPQGILVAIAFFTLQVWSSGQTPNSDTTPSGRVAPPVLKIFLKGTTVPISPTLYGLMTEEINYSFDGGLYAELIRNRIFRNDQNPVNWSLVKAGAGDASMSVVTKEPMNGVLTSCLEVKIKTASADDSINLVNEGYWGIPIKPRTSYHVSFYVKSASDNKFSGSLQVSLQSNDGKIIAKTDSPVLTESWQKVDLTLSTPDDAIPMGDGKFVLTAQSAGTFWLNLVSLFPPTFKDRENGLRVDLMEKLSAMKPTFLRFPGGNYLEGNNVWERFDWKNARGPLTNRPGHPGCWNYRSTDGLGLLEFMQWCEDLNIEPVLAIYAGYSLHQQAIDPGPLLQPFVDDALDELEYLTGETKTYWGALREKDGHAAPFKLNYVEIGNEDNFDKSGTYDSRFGQFFDAIKAKYPNLNLIATTHTTSRAADLYDDHFYRNSDEFFKEYHHYDGADRKGPKIFVGEWACKEGSPTPNFRAALADSAWMIGLENNSDLVVMSCYAPLFVNVNKGGMQWPTNLIGYNNMTSYGSPSYYAQVMFANHLGDVVVPTEIKGGPTGLSIPMNATRETKTGKVYLKMVNTAGTPQPLKIFVVGADQVTSDGQTIVLHAESLDDTNSITEPSKIIPVVTPLNDMSSNYPFTLQPYSVTILEFNAN